MLAKYEHESRDIIVGVLDELIEQTRRPLPPATTHRSQSQDLARSVARSLARLGVLEFLMLHPYTVVG